MSYQSSSSSSSSENHHATFSSNSSGKHHARFSSSSGRHYAKCSSRSSGKHHARVSSRSSSSHKKKHCHKRKPFDYRANITETTLMNGYYRRVLYTVPGKFQLVVMCLKKGEYIKNEVHEGVQFIRVESGRGEIIVDNERKDLLDDSAITIAPGVSHFITNKSDKPLKLYSIYTPPEHDENALDIRQPVD